MSERSHAAGILKMNIVKLYCAEKGIVDEQERKLIIMRDMAKELDSALTHLGDKKPKRLSCEPHTKYTDVVTIDQGLACSVPECGEQAFKIIFGLAGDWYLCVCAKHYPSMTDLILAKGPSLWMRDIDEGKAVFDS